MAAILGSCFTLAGCIGVTPLPKRTRTPQGIEVRTVDLTFIQPGQTTRAEVKEKLKLIDTSYRNDRFFLGRWSSSSSGGWALLVGTGEGGLGGADRFWKVGNLLVEFDEAGVVKKSETFDDAHLLEKLAPAAAGCPMLAPDPMELPVKYWKAGYNQVVSARIVLSASTFEFEELGTLKKRHKFALRAQEVLSVSKPIVADPGPVYTTQTLHFARDLKPLGGPKGKALRLDVSLPELVTLLSYVSHCTKPAD